jgi:glutaminyl-peptide cyclotransferase
MNEVSTELATIEHLILLDLLGAKQPLIRSYFLDTAWMFDALIDIEERLGASGAFEFGEEKTMAAGKWSSFFWKRRKELQNMGHIGDDHMPFLQRGVSVLHMIADPFPHVWHTLKVRPAAIARKTRNAEFLTG